jgi:hypothetical protein
VSLEFSPRAALCTAIVLGGFAMLAAAQLPFGFLGFGDTPREGLLRMAGGRTPHPSVERNILGAVLMHEARRPGRTNVCLRLAEQGRTFEQEKRAIRGLGKRLEREPAARTEIAAHLQRLTAPLRAWLSPAVSSAPPMALPEESAASLHAAERGLLAAARTSGVEIELDGGVVPEALRATGGGCTTLYFSAPAVAGDIAFAATSFQCGPGCGEDWLYAVALRDERWAVVAMVQP